MSIKAFTYKFSIIFFAITALVTIYLLVQENDATTKVVANMPSFSSDTVIVDIIAKNYEELTYESEGGSSWYGKKFHNRKTASGEKYDMNNYTAAHRTLPFGSIAIVENLSNNQKMMVRINDRGPFHGKRIIDLSYAAAKEINNFGNNKVRIQTPLAAKLNLMPNFNYFMAYSLDKPFKCLPSYQVALVDSCEEFDIAYEMYQIKRQNNDGVYLMTKLNSDNISPKKIIIEKYYIGSIKTNPMNNYNILAIN